MKKITLLVALLLMESLHANTANQNSWFYLSPGFTYASVENMRNMEGIEFSVIRGPNLDDHTSRLLYYGLYADALVYDDNRFAKTVAKYSVGPEIGFFPFGGFDVGFSYTYPYHGVKAKAGYSCRVFVQPLLRYTPFFIYFRYNILPGGDNYQEIGFQLKIPLSLQLFDL